MKLFCTFLALLSLVPLILCAPVKVDERDLLFRLAVHARITNDGDDWAESVEKIVPTAYLKLVQDMYINGTWGSIMEKPVESTELPISHESSSEATQEPVVKVLESVEDILQEFESTISGSSTTNTTRVDEDVVYADLEEPQSFIRYAISVLILIAAIFLIGCVAYCLLWNVIGSRKIYYVRGLLDDEN